MQSARQTDTVQRFNDKMEVNTCITRKIIRQARVKTRRQSEQANTSKGVRQRIISLWIRQKVGKAGTDLRTKGLGSGCRSR